MAKIIRIRAGGVEQTAELNDSVTAEKIWDALPIEAKGNTWGDEIYFSIPVKMGSENGQEVVEVGEIGYWPPGNAFCIFFGSTPASIGNECRPASPVNVFGKLTGDPKAFKKVANGAKVTIEKVE